MENYPPFPTGEQNNQDQPDLSAQAQQEWQARNFNQNYQPPIQPADQSSNNESQNPAMHFFLYLVSFLSLCFLSTGAGAILFQFINKNFSDSDALRYDYAGYFSQYAIKYGIAALIIAAPVYFILMYLINKYIYEEKISENSKVRKWLTYIVLFFTAGTILGDLVTLVYNMLGGDIMARFILKVIVVLFIAGAIFSYYLVDMKRKNMAGQLYEINRILAGIAILLVVIITILGFTVVDSPFASRDRKIDDQTVSDLQSIEGQVSNYYRKNSTLPATLNDLEKEDYYSSRELNPSITYQKITATNYKLCATFKRASSDYKTEQTRYYAYENNDQWQYGKGNSCFDKNTDKITPAKTYSNPQTDTLAIEEARKKAQIASIKSNMSSTVPAGVLCRDGDGTVVSGKGGDDVCSGSTNNYNMKWPQMSICGPNSENTQWIVQKGNTDEWDVTLSCKEFPYCDGPSNALCNDEGCKFGGSCQ